jgi:NTE family protein
MDKQPPYCPPGVRIALVLQGGGALGAYQAGVYQALHEHNMTPDWVVGTSIGAINAAIIAGNPPAERLARLEQFWRQSCCNDLIDMAGMPDELRQLNAWLTTLQVLWQGVPGFFRPRPFNPFSFGLSMTPEEAGFYDTSPLSHTLRRLVDFDLLRRPEAMRLTVSAIRISDGRLISFDSHLSRISVEHVMASGALPPGFPPIRVGDDYYWDGGLYSNTPLQVVLDDEPRTSTLCFMVDLWPGHGPAPRSYQEVRNREKDVRYASRSDRHIEAYRHLHNLRRIIHQLYQHVPDQFKGEPDVQDLAGHGCQTVMHIVRLSYPGRDWNMASKDINFSSGSIGWRWLQGYEDARRALEEESWKQEVPPDVGVITHIPGLPARM